MFWICSCWSFFFPFSFVLLWLDDYLQYCVWIAFSNLCVVSIIDFWFVVTMMFWYRNTHRHIHIHTHTHIYTHTYIYTHKFVLSCLSLNCKCISSIPHLYPPLLMIATLCVDDFLPICLPLPSIFCLNKLLKYLLWSYEVGLVVFHSLSFCLCINLLFSLSNLNESLAG